MVAWQEKRRFSNFPYICNIHNIMGDKLLLSFGAKFQRQFIISHVKLQNCYGNVSYMAVPRWRPGLKMLRLKEVTALKDATENLNTRKSTINWVRVFEN